MNEVWKIGELLTPIKQEVKAREAVCESTFNETHKIATSKR